MNRSGTLARRGAACHGHAQAGGQVWFVYLSRTGSTVWWLFAFSRDLFAFLPGFRKADRDCLLAAFHPATFSSRAALCGAAFVAVHFLLDIFTHASRISALRCAGHEISFRKCERQA